MTAPEIKQLIFVVIVFVLTLPYVVIFEALITSTSFVLKDHDNYIREFSHFKSIFDMEWLSWRLLQSFYMIFNSPRHLLFFGFLIFVLSCLFILYHASSEKLYLYLVSILPIFHNVFTSQLRVAVSILFFIYVVVRLRPNIFRDAFIAYSTHVSSLMLFRPLLTVLLPIVPLGVVWFGGRYAIILDSFKPEFRWYYGWELILIAISVYLGRCQSFKIIRILSIWVSIYSAQYYLPVEFTRRLLELAIFTSSPFVFKLSIDANYNSKFHELTYLILGSYYSLVFIKSYGMM